MKNSMKRGISSRKNRIWLKRVMCVASAAVLAAGTILLPESGLFGGIKEVNAAEAVGKSANMVVLVEFADDTSDYTQTGYNKEYSSSISNAPKTYWEALQREFNGENDTFAKGSMKEYFNTVSGGKHEVDSVFPQTNTDGTVTYLKLDNPVASYKGASGEATMIEEIADKLSAAYPDFDGDSVDFNNDGTIDNLMIMASVTTDGQFTPHSGAAGNVSKFAGKYIGPYNIIETRTTLLGSMLIDTFEINTAAHKYIHTFEIPDYYRATNKNGTPVGIWDPMGSPAGRPWPLAVTREAIGWTSVSEKSAVDYSYTLYDASTAYSDLNKKQALKFYTPMSSSEYFVVEYRQKGDKYNNETFDQTAPADGLIVYRVNPAYKDEGNLQGNDYIYVFRP